ncbi:Hypothetical predicted protein [Pelobates cultripes]|uniref:Uncharacterized protein n=1 Tax=Pelobates cultripes TaxID=61616 RepID=A0AAD1WFW5_PELCU|nr:Hypothetical predicted protein [Pelobates cultripes]
MLAKVEFSPRALLPRYIGDLLLRGALHGMPNMVGTAAESSLEDKFPLDALDNWLKACTTYPRTRWLTPQPPCAGYQVPVE